MSEEKWESPTYKVGDEVHSTYHSVQGVVEEVGWSFTFGHYTYKVRRSVDSRYGEPAGALVWVCQSDLKPGPLLEA